MGFLDDIQNNLTPKEDKKTTSDPDNMSGFFERKARQLEQQRGLPYNNQLGVSDVSASNNLDTLNEYDAVYNNLDNRNLQNKTRALAQSNWDAFGTRLKQTPTNLLGGIIEGVGYLGALFTEGWGDNRDYDNILTQVGQSIAEEGILGSGSKKENVVYQTNPNDPLGFLTDGGARIDALASVAESVATFFAEGAGVAAVLSKVGSLARAGATALALNRVQKVRKAAQATEMLVRGEDRTRQLLGAARQFSNATRTLEQIATIPTVSYIEGAMSANKVYKKVEQELKGKVNPKTKKEYTEEEIKHISSQSASTTAQLNTVINSFLNVTSLAPFFKPAKARSIFNREVNKTLQEVEESLGRGLTAKEKKAVFERVNGLDTKTGVTEIDNLGKLNYTAEKGGIKDYLVGKGITSFPSSVAGESLQEGLEELTNVFAEKTGEELGKKGKTKGFLEQFAELNMYAERVGTKEGLASFILGAGMGGAMKVGGSLMYTKDNETVSEKVRTIDSYKARLDNNDESLVAEAKENGFESPQEYVQELEKNPSFMEERLVQSKKDTSTWKRNSEWVAEKEKANFEQVQFQVYQDLTKLKTIEENIQKEYDKPQVDVNKVNMLKKEALKQGAMLNAFRNNTTEYFINYFQEITLMDNETDLGDKVLEEIRKVDEQIATYQNSAVNQDDSQAGTDTREVLQQLEEQKKSLVAEYETYAGKTEAMIKGFAENKDSIIQDYDFRQQAKELIAEFSKNKNLYENYQTVFNKGDKFDGLYAEHLYLLDREIEGKNYYLQQSKGKVEEFEKELGDIKTRNAEDFIALDLTDENVVKQLSKELEYEVDVTKKEEIENKMLEKALVNSRYAKLFETAQTLKGSDVLDNIREAAQILNFADLDESFKAKKEAELLAKQFDYLKTDEGKKAFVESYKKQQQQFTQDVTQARNEITREVNRPVVEELEREVRTNPTPANARNLQTARESNVPLTGENLEVPMTQSYGEEPIVGFGGQAPLTMSNQEEVPLTSSGTSQEVPLTLNDNIPPPTSEYGNSQEVPMTGIPMQQEIPLTMPREEVPMTSDMGRQEIPLTTDMVQAPPLTVNDVQGREEVPMTNMSDSEANANRQAPLMEEPSNLKQKEEKPVAKKESLVDKNKRRVTFYNEALQNVEYATVDNTAMSAEEKRDFIRQAVKEGQLFNIDKGINQGVAVFDKAGIPLYVEEYNAKEDKVLVYNPVNGKAYYLPISGIKEVRYPKSNVSKLQSIANRVQKLEDEDFTYGSISSTEYERSIQDLEKRRQEELNSSDLYHTGDNLTIDNVSVEPRVTRQGRRGQYGGLYTYDNLEDIKNFSRGNNTKNVFGITLNEGVEIKEYTGNIERLDKNKLDELRGQGYQVIKGKSLFGDTEIIIVDKSAIKSIKNHTEINAKYNADLASLEASKTENLRPISYSEDETSDSRTILPIQLTEKKDGQTVKKEEPFADWTKGKDRDTKTIQENTLAANKKLNESKDLTRDFDGFKVVQLKDKQSDKELDTLLDKIGRDGYKGKTIPDNAQFFVGKENGKWIAFPIKTDTILDNFTLQRTNVHYWNIDPKAPFVPLSEFAKQFGGVSRYVIDYGQGFVALDNDFVQLQGQQGKLYVEFNGLSRPMEAKSRKLSEDEKQITKQLLLDFIKAIKKEKATSNTQINSLKVDGNTTFKEALRYYIPYGKGKKMPYRLDISYVNGQYKLDYGTTSWYGLPTIESWVEENYTTFANNYFVNIPLEGLTKAKENDGKVNIPVLNKGKVEFKEVTYEDWLNENVLRTQVDASLPLVQSIKFIPKPKVNQTEIKQEAAEVIIVPKTEGTVATDVFSQLEEEIKSKKITDKESLKKRRTELKEKLKQDITGKEFVILNNYFKKEDSFESRFTGDSKVTKQELDNIAKMLNMDIFSVQKVALSGAVGRLTSDAKILLDENAPAGTAYHEVFEAIYNFFYSPTEQAAILNQLRKTGFKNTAKYKEIQTLYSDKSQNEKDKEYLAEMYRDYSLNRDSMPSGYIKTMFDKLIRFLKSLLKVTPTIEEKFAEIYEGKYKGKTSLNTYQSNFKSADMRLSLEGKKYDYTATTDVLDGLSSYLFNEIMNKDNVYDLTRIGKEALGQHYKNAIESLTSKLNETASDLYDGEFEEDADRLVDLIEKIENNPNPLIRQHLQWLKQDKLSFSADEVDVDIYDNEDQNTEDIAPDLGQTQKGADVFGVEAYKYSVTDKMSTIVKTLLAGIPLMENDGRMAYNSLGLVPVNEFKKLHDYLLLNLVGVPDIAIFSKLGLLANQKPEIKILLNRLGLVEKTEEGQIVHKEFWVDAKLPLAEQQKKFQLQTQFVQHFAKTRLDFTIQTLGEDGKGRNLDAVALEERKDIKQQFKQKFANIAEKENLSTSDIPSLHLDTFKGLSEQDKKTANDLLTKVFNDFLTYRKEIKGEEEDVYKEGLLNFIDNTEEGGNLNKLVDIYLKQDEKKELSLFNSEGKRVYSVSLNTFLTMTFDTLEYLAADPNFQNSTEVEKEQIIDSYLPHVLHIGSRNSAWLESVLKGRGKVKNSILDGVQTADKKLPSNELSKTDKHYQNINATLEGIFPYLRAGDRSKEDAFRVSKDLIIKNGQDFNKRMKGYLTDEIAQIAAMLDGQYDNFLYLEKQAKLVKAINEKLATDKVVTDAHKIFDYFAKFISDETATNILRDIEKAKATTSDYNEIADKVIKGINNSFLDNMFTTLVLEVGKDYAKGLIEDGIGTKADGGYGINWEVKNSKPIIISEEIAKAYDYKESPYLFYTSYLWNDIASKIEQSKLITGAFFSYKNLDDITKRASLPNATRQISLKGEAFNRVKQQVYPIVSDIEDINGLFRTDKSSAITSDLETLTVFADIKAKSSSLDLLREGFETTADQLGYTGEKREKFIASKLKAYESMDEADAFAYYTLDAAKEVMVRNGDAYDSVTDEVFIKEKELQYAIRQHFNKIAKEDYKTIPVRDENGELIYLEPEEFIKNFSHRNYGKYEGANFPQMKGQGFGIAQNGSGYNKVFVPDIHKESGGVIVPSSTYRIDADGNIVYREMAKVMLELEERGIGKLTFGSAKKTGVRINTKESKSKTEIKGINISTKSSDSLGKRLTNPNWYAKDLMDVEAPYKANASKITAKNLNPEQALKYDMDLMYKLQVQKFNRNPELIDEINAKGGLEFIVNSSHIVGVRNSRWEGKGLDSNFIKVLAQSYKTVATNLNKFIDIKKEENISKNGVINPLYNEDGSRNSNYVTQQMHYAYFGIQQKAKRYQTEEVNEGSQYLKLRHANMFNEGIAKDLKENQLSQSALTNSIKRAEELKVARTFSAFDKALNRLGLYLTPDYEVATLQETQVDAKEKLVEILLSQDNGADENLTASIAFLKDADAKIEYLPNAEKLENILFGYLNNNVIKKQVKGAMLPQMPSTFMEDLGTKRSGESNPAYKFYRLSKDGKRVLPMEIAMTLPVDLVDYVTELGKGNRNKGLHIFNNNIKSLLEKIENDEKLSPEEKQLQDTITGIGYRIPTQDLDSLEYMIVKEFLPLETGQSVIVPTEMVAKAGSDFDIDKLTVHFKHLDKGKARTKTVDSVEKAFIKMMGKFMPKKVIDKISLTQNFAEQAAIQDLKNQDITEELIQNLIGQSYSQLTDKQKESFSTIYEEFGEESIEVLSGTLLEEAKTWNLKAPVLSSFYQLDKAAIALVNNSKVEGSLADFISAKEDYKQMDFFEQAKLYAKENNLDTFEEFEQGYKNGDARYMSDKDLFNAELETTKEILGNPINFGEFMTPIGDSILDDIIEQMKPYATDSSKKYSADVVSPRNQVNTSIDFWTGKGKMVGIVALQITALANRLKTKAYVDTNTALSADTDSGLWFPFASNLKDFKIPINKTTNSEKVLISEILSALATIVLDVAKDPKAAKLGFTLQTANAALYMLNLGVPVNVVFKFLSLPVIKSYLTEQKINESLLYNQEYAYTDFETNQRKKEKKGKSNFDLQKKYGVNEWLHSMINSFDSVKNSEAYEYFNNTQKTLNLIANEYNEKTGQFGYELEQFNKEGLTEEFLDVAIKDELKFDHIIEARKKDGIEITEEELKEELDILLLGTFLEVQRQSKIWGKMIKAYGHDTSRAKDSVTLDKLDEAASIVDDSFIKEAGDIYWDDNFNLTQMGVYYEVYKLYSKELLSPNFYLTKQNETVQKDINYYKDKIAASLPADKKDRAIMDFVNGYAMFSYLSSNESKNNIKPFFEEGVVATELLILKQMKNNDLLNRLSVLEEIRLTENNAEKEYYIIFNKTKLSDREKNKLVENWRMLAESPKTREFAVNLAKQTMLQTGNKATYYSFTELIPFEIWEFIMHEHFEAKDVASYFDLWRRQAINASNIPNKTTLKLAKNQEYTHFATYGTQNAEAMSVKEVKNVKRSKEDSKRKKKVVQEKTLNYYVSLMNADGTSQYNLKTDKKGKVKIIVPFVKVQKLGNDKRVDYTKNPNDCNG